MYDSFTIKWRDLGYAEPSSDIVGQQVSGVMLLFTVLRFMENDLLDQNLLIGACVLPGLNLWQESLKLKSNCFRKLKPKTSENQQNIPILNGLVILKVKVGLCIRERYLLLLVFGSLWRTISSSANNFRRIANQCHGVCVTPIIKYYLTSYLLITYDFPLFNRK